MDGESMELKFFKIQNIPGDVTRPFIDVKKDLLAMLGSTPKSSRNRGAIL
jgi:hypothetical protein